MGKQGLRVYQDPKKKYEYWVSKFKYHDIKLRVLVGIEYLIDSGIAKTY